MDFIIGKGRKKFKIVKVDDYIEWNKKNNQIINVKVLCANNNYMYWFYNKEYGANNKKSDLVIVQTDYGYINVTVDSDKNLLILGYMNAKFF